MQLIFKLMLYRMHHMCGIPKSLVEAFVIMNMCHVCQKKKSQHNQSPLKPIMCKITG